VELRLKNTHDIWGEVSRWREILDSSWHRFKLTGQMPIIATSLQ
jgi:hypothetical protein